MDIKQINKYLFHYRGAMFTPTMPNVKGQVSDELVLAFIGELMRYGYTLDSTMIEKLKCKDIRSSKMFMFDAVDILSDITGAKYSYEPLFKSFPNHINQSTEEILKKIQILVKKEIQDEKSGELVLLRCGHLVKEDTGNCPICSLVDVINEQEIEKATSTEIFPLKIIKFVDKDELNNVFVNLVGGNKSLSPYDVAFVSEFVLSKKQDVLPLIPLKIVKRETAVLLAGLFYQLEMIEDSLKILLKTATDVLRFAVYLSSRSTSLVKDIDFKLSRPQRKLILSLMNEMKNSKEDILRYKSKWQKLAHCLHIGEFSKKYPVAVKSISISRTNEKVQTFNSRFHSLLDGRQIEMLLDLMATRPGEFLRRLDFVLRSSEQTDLVIEKFKLVMPKISSINLLTLKKVLQNRTKKAEQRSFVLGSGKVKVLNTDSRSLLSEDVVQSISEAIDTELIERFSKEESWENVYLSENLKKVLLPTSEQSTSSSMLKLTKGSRIPLEAKRFIRLFCHWQETPESGPNVDLDLGAVGLREDFSSVFSIYYRNLNNELATHSGDVRSAPQGASEFIDVDIEACLRNGVRYVVASLHSFSSQKFETFSCSAGFMQVDVPSSGKVFDAKTVKNRFLLASDSRMNIPFLIDLVSMELVWIDTSGDSTHGGNVINSANSIRQIVVSVNQLKDFKPSLYDLLSLHVKARAKNVLENVEDLEEFDEETPFIRLDIDNCLNMEEIFAKYLR